MAVLVVFKEAAPETRVAATPATVKRLVALGIEVRVEPGAGVAAGFSDADYTAAGAQVGIDPGAADVVLRVTAPEPTEIEATKPGALQVSFLDPFNRKDLLEALAARGINAVSMEMMPRTTLAQKMDALSSQANLAGYQAVVAAAERLDRIFPMMMTPAGTLSPAKVFVIGVGVAGLQAIATAKRLGGRVEAFDTRPVVEEQVKSLGAKFLKIDLGEMGQTAQGYAKELTPEQIEKQRQGMAKACAQADVVITTAKLFGRPAPKIVTKEMVAHMHAGAIIVDLAAETGGNVEGTVPGEEVVTENGVRIIGDKKLEWRLPRDASEMYASNLAHFLEHFWDREQNGFPYRFEDEILKGCLLTHGGQVVHERFKQA